MFEIRVKQNGRTMRKITGYTSQDAALIEGQAMADKLPTAAGVTFEVHPSPSKRNSSHKSRYRGHDIKTHKQGKFKYVVEPYGHKFETKAAAKRWIDGHIKRESPKTNPAPPTRRKSAKRAATKSSTRKNPPSRKALTKRLSAERIDWQGMTKTQIKAVQRTAKAKGDTDLAAKATAALRRCK